MKMYFAMLLVLTVANTAGVWAMTICIKALTKAMSCLADIMEIDK